MCGIAGVFAPTASPRWRARVFRKLLVLAQSRGDDATGYAYSRDGNMVVVKDGVKASEFVYKNPDFLQLFNEADNGGYFPDAIIGHARGATKGLSTGPEDNDNNHPFFAESIGVAMIHNGLISNDDDWRDSVGRERGLASKPISDVDSEVMLRAVETFYLKHQEDKDRGLTEAIDDACYCVAGTYALVFLKADEPNAMWLVKHKNPVHLAWVPSKKAIIFASTKEMIESALSSEKVIMDFFIENTQIPAVINYQQDDTLVKITHVGEEKREFDLDVLSLDCATGPGRVATDDTGDKQEVMY